MWLKTVAMGVQVCSPAMTLFWLTQLTGLEAISLQTTAENSTYINSGTRRASGCNRNTIFHVLQNPHAVGMAHSKSAQTTHPGWESQAIQGKDCWMSPVSDQWWYNGEVIFEGYLLQIWILGASLISNCVTRASYMAATWCFIALVSWFSVQSTGWPSCQDVGDHQTGPVNCLPVNPSYPDYIIKVVSRT